MLGTKDYLFLWCMEISNPIWRVVDVKIYGAWAEIRFRGREKRLVFKLYVSFNFPRVRCLIHPRNTRRRFHAPRPSCAPKLQFSITIKDENKNKGK